jgi:CRISPR/Cas system CSM-associated protein Csm2 small subunit
MHGGTSKLAVRQAIKIKGVFMKIELRGLVGKDFNIEGLINVLKKELEKMGVEADIEYTETENNFEDLLDFLNKKIKKSKKVF